MFEFLKPEYLDKDYSEFVKLIDDGRRVGVMSMAENARPHAAAVLGRFVLYVARDAVHAAETREKLACFFDKKVLTLPGKDDFLIYKQGAVAGITKERLSVLKELASGSVGALVVSAETLMQYLPKPEIFRSLCIDIKAGGERDIYDAAERLTLAGYTRTERISSVGEFALRGDILDIYPVADNPVRINFFGDTVESIRVIDADSMIGIRAIKEITVCPASEILLVGNAVHIAAERIERQEVPKGADRLRLKNITAAALERLERGGGHCGFDWVIPFAAECFSTVFEWLPADAAIVYDEPNAIHERLKSAYREFFGRVVTLTAGGEVYPAHKDAAVDESKSLSGAAAYPAAAFMKISSLNPFFVPDAVLNMPSIRTAPYHTDYNMLCSDLKVFLKTGKRVVLCCKDRERAKTLYGSLNDKFSRLRFADEMQGAFDGIYIAPFNIKDGFSIEKSGLVVVGFGDLFRYKEKKEIQNGKKRAGYIPAPGDFVVHDIHGIGKFVGIEKIKTGEVARDYGRVSYRDEQTLYVPVENLDNLSKYTGGGEPKLSKMGGAEFAKVKASVIKSVKQLAFSLLDLYNRRENAAGHVYAKDTEWQKEFEDSFEYEETDDQLSAVADIKNDLENGRIMDRLLCGDVGYGKTEVALRAVFKVVMEGKQAAILAPTTILARQHYNTILARMKEYKFNAGILSRFESREESEKTLKDLKDGKLNIIVATHRLLSKDVCFFDLGLLVLDEEQRFGVEHKEKIKTIKSNVNVLTLSATPIPRTLHMSLSGIRDISLLETPPQNRVPVETYVTEYSDALIRDAVLREKGRGGQTFILYNRVETIDSYAYGLSRLFEDSDVKMITAHGRMSGAVLDEKMTSFYNGEADLLICTTIIENGLDLPNANTIIICEADRLGLATLYQLRGRVGRSGLTAHAYFTYEGGKAVTENAMKRLNAIMDYTDFGSGYKLAMRDLEIRGAGNILGAEQHGHMEKVGYEMYSRMLKEAVGELRGEREAHGRINETEVKIDSDIDTYIDDAYVSGEQKTEMYGRIARIDSEQKRREYIDELTDIYGKPGKALVNLTDIALVKNTATGLGIKKVMINNRGLGIVFDKEFAVRDKLLKLISRDLNVVLTGTDNVPTLLFKSQNLNAEQKLEKIKVFLNKLTATLKK